MTESAGTAHPQPTRPPRPDRLRWRSGTAEAEAVLRPDHWWMLRLPPETEAWPVLIAVRPPAVDRMVIQVSDRAPQEGNVLRAAGFTAARIEQVWRIPLASLPDAPTASSAHRLVPVTECDLERVTTLDNTIRRDIPGATEWSGTVDDLRQSLDDDEFDPDLYLIAEHKQSGDYHGLIRVWSRPHQPRLGCLGAVPSWRRTRLVPLLLAAVTRTLGARGVAEVVTETDVTNRAVMLLARNHGAVGVEQLVEWVLEP